MTFRVKTAVLAGLGALCCGWVNPEVTYYDCPKYKPKAVPGEASPDLLPPLFSIDNPLREPIPPDALLHQDSAIMVQWMKDLVYAQGQGFLLGLSQWTVPVYLANISPSEPTPRYDVELLSKDFRAYPQWNTLIDVPIPAWASPSFDGTTHKDDAHMVVVDMLTGDQFEFWGYCRERSGRHTAAFGNVISIESDGIFDLQWQGDEYLSGCSSIASGIASINGLIWPQELESGEIDHALLFTYPSVLEGGPVLPATNSDGHLTYEALPMGVRVRLDPALDLDSLVLDPWQRTIAAALQRYGMILADTGGANIGLEAVDPKSYPEGLARYEGLLPEGPGPFALPKELVDHLQVLDFGDQLGVAPGCYADEANYD